LPFFRQAALAFDAAAPLVGGSSPSFDDFDFGMTHLPALNWLWDLTKY